jgi:hypothetical protein
LTYSPPASPRLSLPSLTLRGKVIRMKRACFYCGAAAVATDFGIPLWVPERVGLADARVEHLVTAENPPPRVVESPVDQLPPGTPAHPALGDVQPGDRLREAIDAAIEQRSELSLADYSARSLCRVCAEALAELDAEAVPLLEPMVEGEARRYSPEEQVLLAAWGARAAYAVLAVERKSAGVPRSHRRAVRERRRPHENAFVGYGRYRRPSHIGVLAARLLTRLEAEGDGVEAYSVLAVFGHLVLKVFGVHRRPTTTRVKAPEGLMVRFWPQREEEVGWPPLWSMTERSLEDAFLVEPFYRPFEYTKVRYLGPGKKVPVRRRRTEGLGPGRA